MWQVLYFLYSKEVGKVLSPKGEEVDMVWLTCRKQTMTTIGGALNQALVGWRWKTEEDGSNAPSQIPYVAEYFDQRIRIVQEVPESGYDISLKGFLDVFCRTLRNAKRRQEEDEAKCDANSELLHYLHPIAFVDNPDDESYEGPNYTMAFTEEEAAQAAFKKGFRAVRRTDGQWSWYKLGKLQEEEVTA